MPPLVSELDYNILGGVACTDALLRLPRFPADRRTTGWGLELRLRRPFLEARDKVFGITERG